MGKKRSRSQRIGMEGENEFRRFAGRHGLLANKVEEDFGTDFICQIETRPDKRGTARIAGGVVGAFVRTTTNRRPRIKIKRDDAEHLLSCDYPVVVVLVHAFADMTECHVRFIDEELGQMLGDFLLGGRNQFTVTPALLGPESKFDEQLHRALLSGFVEQVRLKLAATRVRSVIPESRIQVRRTTEGGLTLVQVKDFLSQYDHGHKQVHDSIYTALFGHDSHFSRRLGEVPIRQELLAALARLPNLVVIGGLIHEGEVELEVVGSEGTAVKCVFTVRGGAGHTGWIHRCGFAITLPEPTQHEGTWVHFLRAHPDQDADVELADHEDLWRFLAACKEDAGVRLGAADEHLFPVTQFNDLPLYGFFASCLRTVSEMQWPPRTWLLSDAANEETLATLGFLATLVKAPERLGFFGFAFGNEEQPTSEESDTLWAPIVMNLPRAGLVAWVRTRGTALREDDNFVGFRFGTVEEIRLDLRAARFEKSAWPEVVYHPAHRSVPMVRSAEELNENRSVTSNWQCRFLPRNVAPPILGQRIDVNFRSDDREPATP